MLKSHAQTGEFKACLNPAAPRQCPAGIKHFPVSHPFGGLHRRNSLKFAVICQKKDHIRSLKAALQTLHRVSVCLYKRITQPKVNPGLLKKLCHF